MQKVGKYLVGYAFGAWTELGYGSGYYEIVVIDTETHEVFQKSLSMTYGDCGGYNNTPHIGHYEIEEVNSFIRNNMTFEGAFNDEELSKFINV